VLTVHERLTAPVVSRSLSCRARACNADVRCDCGHEPHKTHLEAPLRPSLPPKPASAQPIRYRANPTPNKSHCLRLKSHR
jgi:hypothetical protein